MNSNQDMDRIVSLMKQVSEPDPMKQSDLLNGVVTSIAPLIIKVDDRFDATESFLTLSALVRPGIFPIVPHTHTDSEGGTTSESLPSIQLWRGLRPGDVVRMLRVSEGSRYYVIEREGGLTL